MNHKTNYLFLSILTLVSSVSVYFFISNGSELKFFKQLAQTSGSSNEIPKILSVSLPSYSNSLDVPINSIVTTSSKGVAGYYVSENPLRPDINSVGWTVLPPKSILLSDSGLSKTLLLVVANNLISNPEFLAWKSQVVSEGWAIVEKNVEPIRWNDPRRENMARQILAYTQEVKPKAVLFVGGVARAVTGKSAPDGHQARSQWADFIYNGSIDPSKITDNQNLVSGEIYKQWNNVPGDGRWDHILLKGPARWSVGRVDFFDLGAMPRQGLIKNPNSYLKGTPIIPAVNEQVAVSDYFKRNIEYRTGKQKYEETFFYNNAFLEPNWLQNVKSKAPWLTFKLFSTTDHTVANQDGAGKYFFGMYPFFTLYRDHHNWSNLDAMAKVVWMDDYKSFEQDPYFEELYPGDQGVRRWLQHALFVTYGPPDSSMLEGVNVSDSYIKTYSQPFNYEVHKEVAGDPTLPLRPYLKTVYPSGVKNLYFYVKDFSGNISELFTAKVSVVLSGSLGTTIPNPEPIVDVESPNITSFVVSNSLSSLTVPVLVTASDNVGVTGYMIKENSTKPLPNDSGWTTVAPTSYKFNTPGTKSLYAFAKDAVGNVSNIRSAKVVITDSENLPFDSKSPEIISFSSPSASNSLSVDISISATDNVAVTGYLLKENVAVPLLSDSGWTTVAPTSYKFNSEGLKTLYAFVKDASGNISPSVSRIINISIPVVNPPTTQLDTTPPVVSEFSMPATSNSLNVPIFKFVATDNVGVIGYFLYNAPIKPNSNLPNWSPTPQKFFAFSFSGEKIMYGFAKDAAGNVSLGFKQTILLDNVPPSVPSGLTLSSIGSNSLSLSWTQSSDNLGVSAYTVSRNGVHVATTTTASFTDTGLNSSTQYEYGIRAVDRVGNRSSSSNLSVKTN